ncbi:erythromycin esterase family protein [Actinopolymorpha sp. B11F2]|uniref:erythromycin esterase family protein n=1 Tax=Actinopolymorpha sp. B11F2 TaxID=3160862 RepID=UPI0032E3A40A
MPSGHGAFAGWLRTHVTRLDALDPNDPLDDLEPLRELVGDAQVVAVGESAHFISEFTCARQRIVRFLVERCGFSAFAFEFGFSEAFGVDRWVQGEGAEADLSRVSEAASAWGAGNLMRFLRDLSTRKGHPVRFLGIDIPEAGGSLLPALLPVADYLRDVDVEIVPLVESAIATAERFAGRSGASAAPAWAKLEPAEQDGLTAALTRLLLRFRALRPLYVERSNPYDYDVALHRLEAAGHAEYMLRAMSGLFAGTGLRGDLSIRDRYMAESIRWHLDHSEPGTRIVLAAHNNHIQKMPVAYGGVLTTLPMGQHLDRMLGTNYLALAVTSTAEHTPDMRLDATSAVGFTVVDMPLEVPPPGSIEAAALDAGVHLGLADLRQAPADVVRGLDRIRSQSAYLHTPVAEAFDGVLVIPTVTIEEDLGI